ncbi:MAG: hypothetical protein IT364_05070 [Candidatus Hydrogenedentes bacterium]|nr:hypothetical protein [Candidatus Hydrogenedentota bacterium]
MFAVLLAMMGATMGTEGTIWTNALDARTSGISVPARQEYAVWVWATDAADTVSLAGHELAIPKDEKSGGQFTWRNAGKVPLDAGAAQVVIANPIAVAQFCITTNADLVPSNALGDQRVFDQPVTPGDTRADIDRGTNTLFFMTPFADRAEWESFADGLRRRFLVACGLWPMPERTPLNAKVYDDVVHDDYIVSKAYFEARPGLLVTGNLYRPVGDGPFPGVICPHGHWDTGRLEDGERGSVPGRCITLARMGMVVFSYDMVGYNDSCQFDKAWGHGGGIPDEARKAQALWGLHPFAVQLWSSVRALDFMETLPYVNAQQLACTGASGGGTQTFALNAVDPRVKVSAPVNMISHSMQGGCICENAPIIRFNACNMEVGALAAPRPMMMVSATGDWTRETQNFEYPAIHHIYEMYGAGDRVANVHVDAPHNYNQASREAVYRFFGKWILGQGEKYANFSEPPFTVEPREKLQNFPDSKPPAGYPDYATLVAQTIDQTRAKWDALLPQNAGGYEAFSAKARPALADIVTAELPCAKQVRAKAVSTSKEEGYSVERVVLSADAAQAVPALIYRPADNKPTGVAVLVHGAGKAALSGLEKGGPGALVSALMAKGRVVMTLDPFLVGENLSTMKETKRRTTNFPDTFLPTDTAYRIQDTLAALLHARTLAPCGASIDLIGLGDAGIWALFAGALDAGVDKTIVDANGFAVNDDAAWVAGPYMPCIRGIGDVTTAAALYGSRELLVVGGNDAWSQAVRAYAAVSGRAPGDIVTAETPGPEALASAL